MPAAASIPPALTDVPVSYKSQSSGNVAFDHEYFYVKYNGWRRFPLVRVSNVKFGFPTPDNEGNIYTDNQYFYLVVNRQWKKLPIFVIKPLRPIMGEVPMINIRNTKLTTFPRGTDNYGRWGMIAFNAEYFCIWGQGKWHKIPVARLSNLNRSVENPIPQVTPKQEGPPEGVTFLTVIQL